MAVTRVAERWEGRGAAVDEKGVRTLTRQWTVETDDDATGEPEVIDGVVAVDASAALFAAHPNWAWSVCRGLSAKPNGGPRIWLVDAAYSSAPLDRLQSQDTPAHERPPQVTLTRKEVTEPLEFDVLTDEPVLNTVGDPFDPPPDVFRSHHVITWKFFRREADLDWDSRAQWMDTLNSDTVTIYGREYPPYTLRCIDYSLDEVMEAGETELEAYIAITVQAEYNPATWDVQILNTGRQKLVSGEKVVIVDGNGQPVADPVPLDVDGEPVEPGGTYYYADPAGYLAYDWNGTDATLTGPDGILA